MPDYRRVPGGTFFFTVNLRDRRSDLLVTQIGIIYRSVDDGKLTHLRLDGSAEFTITPKKLNRQLRFARRLMLYAGRVIKTADGDALPPCVTTANRLPGFSQNPSYPTFDL